jgi:hypothetical protein
MYAIYLVNGLLNNAVNNALYRHLDLLDNYFLDGDRNLLDLPCV